MTAVSKEKIGGILLAAGGSRRLGRPKQLLKIDGETLIRRSAGALIDAGCDPVVVVLGVEAGACRNELANLKVHIVENEDWAAGMSGSIRAGISAVCAAETGVSACLIALCDQPKITAGRLAALVSKYKNSDASAIASRYEGTLGVPAIFSKQYFTALSELSGDRGARVLFKTIQDLSTFDLPEAAFDIDLPSDASL